jgi:hypothetical protein
MLKINYYELIVTPEQRIITLYYRHLLFINYDMATGVNLYEGNIKIGYVPPNSQLELKDVVSMATYNKFSIDKNSACILRLQSENLNTVSKLEIYNYGVNNVN